jgi:hypothetical protein
VLYKLDVDANFLKWMAIRMRSLLLPFLLLISLSGDLIAEESPDKYALLVAVSDYDHPDFGDLGFPEIDAAAIGKLLKASGYEVELLTGSRASQKAIRNALAKFSERGNNKGVVFVGIFGHGIEYSGSKRSFYCPYDARIQQITDAKGQKLFNDDRTPKVEPSPGSLVAIDEFLVALRESAAANRVLIADCCRDDPNRPRGRSFGSALEINQLPTNAAVFFACSENQKAYEHAEWGHGAFTKCFLEQLESGKSLMGSVAEEVAPAVETLVDAKRRPGDAKQTPRLLVTGARIDLQLKAVNLKAPRMKPSPAAKSEFNNGIGMTMVLIPRNREGLDYDYYLGKYEVTQREYQSLTGSNPSYFHSDKPDSERADYPVEQISWEEASNFCKMLNEKEAESGQLPADMIYRLPWKKEWEAASRKSDETLNEAALLQHGWFRDNSGQSGTAAIGLKEPSETRIHDLFGNVAEMCLDQEPDDKTGVPLHFVAGGGWFHSAKKTSAAAEQWTRRETKLNYQGFRLVLGPATPPASAESDQKN